MRAPVHPIHGWRMQAQEIEGNVEFTAECLKLWDQGKDTKDISLLMMQPEYIVEAAVRLGRERRRRMERWHGEKEDGRP